MSLFINNLATDKQVAMLHKLEYIGRGKYAAEQLTKQEAAEILNELFEEERLDKQATELAIREANNEGEYPF